MLIMDELMSKFIEPECFRQFMNVVQPNFKFVSRTIVVKNCLGIYACERRRLEDVFVKFGQRVCLTTDLWSSLQKIFLTCVLQSIYF